MTTPRTRREELELRRKLADQVRSEMILDRDRRDLQAVMRWMTPQKPKPRRWPKLLLICFSWLVLCGWVVAGLIAAMRWAVAKGWL
jgi:hypothetical protein